MVTWTANIPNQTHTPAMDQPIMEANNNYLQLEIGKDHNFTTDSNNPQDGYHKTIHFVPLATYPTPPAPIATIGQLYTGQATIGATTDTALFFESGNGFVTQLTGFIPGQPSFSPTFDGYTTLPGGIILQWGRSPGNTLPSTGMITFPVAFPNNVFIINPTLISKAAGTGETNTISNIGGTTTLTTWNWNYTGTTSYVGFYWIAIGN
jgi:tail fiber protein gp53